MVKNSARVNEETDPALLLQRQQQENAALREELALLKEGADVSTIESATFASCPCSRPGHAVPLTDKQWLTAFLGRRDAQHVLVAANQGQGPRFHARRQPRCTYVWSCFVFEHHVPVVVVDLGDCRCSRSVPDMSLCA